MKVRIFDGLSLLKIRDDVTEFIAKNEITTYEVRVKTVLINDKTFFKTVIEYEDKDNGHTTF